MLARAIAIAVEAHSGQLDKSGQPFIGHPLRVMARLAPDENAMIVGVLHDLIEDTPVTILDLEEQGFNKSILTALTHLTRLRSESYFTYIARCSQDVLACRVKLADLRDNMDVNRGWDNTKKITKTRYLPAWMMLTGYAYNPEVDGR